MEEENSTIQEVTSTEEVQTIQEDAEVQIIDENQPETTAEEPEMTEDVTDGTELDKKEEIATHDWEKAAKDNQASFTKVSIELSELKKELEKQKQMEETAQLQQAKALGFSTVEEAAIVSKVQEAERDFYYQYSSNLEPDEQLAVQKLLLQYTQTGNKALLSEAKSYFGQDFVEHVAQEKLKYQNQLESEHKTQKTQAEQEAQLKFINSLEADNKEFLTDLDANPAKANALVTIYRTGAIRSQGDMDAFKKIYSDIFEAGVNSVKSEQQTKSEIDEQVNKMQTVATSSNEKHKGEKWFSKEEWDNMSGRDLERFADKIDRQMELEAKGEIPKQILA